MTDYQRIENELLRLGYTKEYGKGDHIKFFKDGLIKPISVSLNIGGRSYTNVISQIRRVEPNFSLDKQTPSKKPEETERLNAIKRPDCVPEWQVPGAYVRWTKPEGQDWKMLSNPNSVMNKRYEITDYKSTKGSALVQITESGTNDTFFVHPQDIDDWEIVSCEECGKMMPANIFAKDREGHMLCEDCMEKKIHKQVMEATVEDLDPDSEKASLIKSAFGDEYGDLCMEMEMYCNKYSDIKNRNLTQEEKEDIKVNFGGVVNRLPAKIRRRFLRDHTLIADIINGTEAKEKPAKKPYDAWMTFLKDMSTNIIGKNIATYDTSEKQNRLQKEFYGTPYS